MHSKIIPVIGAGAVSLTLALAYNVPASARPLDLARVGDIASAGHHGTPSIAFHGGMAAPTSPTNPATVCFSNLTGDTGDAFTSQNFETAFDAYDSLGADDFKLTQACTIDSIDVPGQYFNGAGPAASETVTFYTDAGGTPGNVINTQTVVGVDSAGSFHIPLAPVLLGDDDPYWVSVQVNMDFNTGGQWGWENTSNQVGLPAQWENPLDGFGTGCTTFSTMQTCLGAPGPDFMLGLNGTPFKYQFNPITRPTKQKYTTRSCAEGLGSIADGTILSQLTDAHCTNGHKKAYVVQFSPSVQKLSVPASWPNWGSPSNTESSTPDVLFSQAATSLTITYNFGVKTGGFEAQPVGTGTHAFAADFYSGNNGTGIELGSVTRLISGNAGARLLAAHCKFKGWGSIVVSTDVPFAIAVDRV